MDLKQTLKFIKLNETKIKITVGAIVLLPLCIFAYIKFNKTPKTDTLTGISTSLEKEGKTIYEVQKGDNLWKIAENFYQNGNKWNIIAFENNLSNPNLIHSGNILIIPQK